MIIKSYEADKINLANYPYILLYGKNEGLKNAIKRNLLKNLEITSSYDEKDILENKDDFIEKIYSGSLFILNMPQQQQLQFVMKFIEL